MTRTSGINIANGVISFIVLICGITLSTLMGLLVKKILDVLTMGSDSFHAGISALYWAVGFIYIVPGCTGMLASVIYRTAAFIAEVVFCVVALIILVASLLKGLKAPATRSLFDSKFCYFSTGKCICNDDQLESLLTHGFACEDINTLTHTGVAADAILVVGGAFTFLALILAALHFRQGKGGEVTVLNVQQTSVEDTTFQRPSHTQHVVGEPRQHIILTECESKPPPYSSLFGPDTPPAYTVEPIPVDKPVQRTSQSAMAEGGSACAHVGSVFGESESAHAESASACVTNVSRSELPPYSDSDYGPDAKDTQCPS